jgi:hypothetical protein
LSVLTVFYRVETLGNLTHVNVDPFSSSKESALGPEQSHDIPMS